MTQRCFWNVTGGRGVLWSDFISTRKTGPRVCLMKKWQDHAYYRTAV